MKTLFEESTTVKRVEKILKEAVLQVAEITNQEIGLLVGVTIPDPNEPNGAVFMFHVCGNACALAHSAIEIENSIKKRPHLEAAIMAKKAMNRIEGINDAIKNGCHPNPKEAISALADIAKAAKRIVELRKEEGENIHFPNIPDILRELDTEGEFPEDS